jgi:transcriptional regulator with XRE-family HTH domain
MVIGERLRELREEKKLSQGEIEERTGLLRCYISPSFWAHGKTKPRIATFHGTKSWRSVRVVDSNPR